MSGIIVVKLNGRGFPTNFDEHGVQRFVEDPILSKIIEGLLSAYNKLGYIEFEKLGLYGLNELSIDYQLGRGDITLDRMLDFYTSMGYSVSGMLDLSYFEDVEVDNPLWN